MRALVVGFGSIGKRHCRLLMKQGFGAADIFVAEMQEERRSDAEEAGHNLFDLGSDREAQFDIAVVACSTASHIQVLQMLPEVTKLLYIEKPLAHDFLKVAPVARSLKKRLRSAKVVVGYMLRHHPAVQVLQEKIQNQEFGKILKYRAECGMYLPNWHPWEDYRDFYMSDVDGGGGALLDISHEIDLMSYLVGPSQRVFGMLGNLSSLECSSDDFSEMVLHHHNGTFGSISLDLIQKNTFRKTRIVFENAEVEIDFIAKSISVHTGINEVKADVFELEGDDLYLYQYKDALSENSHVSCSLEQALDVMQIIHAVRTSSLTGAFVNLPIYSGIGS